MFDRVMEILLSVSQWKGFATIIAWVLLGLMGITLYHVIKAAYKGNSAVGEVKKFAFNTLLICSIFGIAICIVKFSEHLQIGLLNLGDGGGEALVEITEEIK
jgi:hypothetical protein